MNVASAKEKRKVLYEKNGEVEDNHVDDTFLQSLKTNANLSQYDMLGIMTSESTAAVVSQLAMLCAFMTTFFLIMEDRLNAIDIGTVNLVGTTAGYSVTLLLSPTSLKDVGDHFKIIFLFVALVALLSPVLKTLTESVADDSIYACTAALFTVHLFSHDYAGLAGNSSSLSNADKDDSSGVVQSSVTGVLSLNAAMLGAVLLASRLSSDLLVFMFVMLAIEVFAFAPSLRQSLLKLRASIYVPITMLLLLLVSMFIARYSLPMARVFVAAEAFLWIGCPFWLVHIQQYKKEYQGPWDIPKGVSSTVFEM